jgi:hypothetical protein
MGTFRKYAGGHFHKYFSPNTGILIKGYPFIMIKEEQIKLLKKIIIIK